jgi:hypothetical protein
VASDGKGRVQSYSLRCNGTYALGAYTTLLLDRPSTSPCNDKVVIGILRGKGGATDPIFLLPDLDQRVAIRGPVICPDSGIWFTPLPDLISSIYSRQTRDGRTDNEAWA